MNSHHGVRKPTNRGIWIAVFGPDGVGKSAVIDQLEEQLEPAFCGAIQFHFRPMFRRRGLLRVPVTDPHGQSPRGVGVSCCKLIYWLADCWWGYLIAIRPGLRRSRLVIFDRYYPDLLVDPLRYRLPTGSLRFAGWLAKLAPRPDLCFLLDAPAEIVHRRKHELPLAELQRQRAAYLKMFESTAGNLIVSADCPVNEVARQIAVAILNLPVNSAFNQREALPLADL